MGFSLSHNDELKSLERGTSAADTKLSNQDFDVPLSIQDADMKCRFRTTKESFVSR